MDDPDGDARPSSDWRAEVAARTVARQLELRIRQNELQPEHFDLSPADVGHDPDSGRTALAPAPGLRHLGRYLVRSRRYADKTQKQLADECGLSQPTISRIERAVAPAMSLERFVALCQALGRLFPLGFCPHEHDCAWQQIRAPQRTATDAARFLEYLLKTVGDPS